MHTYTRALAQACGRVYAFSGFPTTQYVHTSFQYWRLATTAVACLLALLACFAAAWLLSRKQNKKQMTTFNGGSLGSCIDEERSQLR